MNKKPIIVSNFDEKTNLDISIISCHLFDLSVSKNEKYYTYIKPIYTKMDGIYGYVCVSGHRVFFFWYNNETENINCDDVTDKFRVEYVTEKHS